MTLCIAARCIKYINVGKNVPMVVLSADQQVEIAMAGAETEFKYERLSPHWIAMLAGTLHHARELAGCYRTELLASEEGLKDATVLEALHRPLNAMRYRLADRYTQRRVAMSYDDFLRNGRHQLPDFLHQEMSGDIARQQIEAELILVGYLGTEFVLFKIDGYSFDVVQWSAFAVVGTGSTIAMGNLFQRQHTEFDSLQNTLYAVYESHRLGRIAPGVGMKNIMIVLRKGATRIEHAMMAPEDALLYDGAFDKFGPRAIPDDIAIPEGVELRLTDAEFAGE
jgi:hypothetical protein